MTTELDYWMQKLEEHTNKTAISLFIKKLDQTKKYFLGNLNFFFASMYIKFIVLQISTKLKYEENCS